MLVCPKCSRAFAAGVRQCPHDGSTLELSGEGVDPMLGTVIDGRYRIEERVGAGGMGTVYRAVQTNIGRDVAVKIVNALALQNPEMVRRFENEAHIISQLRHPNTLKLIDFGKLGDGRPYLVTEFLTGVSLEAVLMRERKSPQWTLGVMRQVCDSLAEAHEKGIIHRDLKPENIFIEEVGGDAIVRVLDFGIAKLGKGSQTATGTVFGTPAYMSPEQAQGRGADARSDLYSLGTIAYKCIAGRTPFVSDEPLALLLMHVNEPPAPLSRACPPNTVPPAIEAFLMSLIAKDPDRRPSSAVEVRMRIDQLLNFTPNPTRLRPLTPSQVPAVGPPTSEISEPVIAFAPSTNTGAFKSSTTVRFLGVLLLSLAVAIAAGAFFSQEPDDDTTVESIIEDPPPIPLAAPSLDADGDADADAPEPDAVKAEAPKPEPTVKKRRKKRRRKTKSTSGGGEKKTSEDDENAPAGFVDFEVD
ncbi:MAG: serine/threonine-protein kinase [Deltaproteobacteria bacterium]